MDLQKLLDKIDIINFSIVNLKSWTLEYRSRFCLELSKTMGEGAHDLKFIINIQEIFLRNRLTKIWGSIHKDVCYTFGTSYTLYFYLITLGHFIVWISQYFHLEKPHKPPIKYVQIELYLKV